MVCVCRMLCDVAIENYDVVASLNAALRAVSERARLCVLERHKNNINDNGAQFIRCERASATTVIYKS